MIGRRRWVAMGLALVLAHGAWLGAAMPCAGGRGGGTATLVTPAADHAAHAMHHGAQPDAADMPSSDGTTPTDECPLLLQCALLLAPPTAAPVIARAMAVGEAVPTPAVAWRDGPPQALDPPPPKRA